MASDYDSIRADNKRRYGTDIGRIGPMLMADRYDNRTHFIFELLQNADDAGASIIHIGIRDPIPGAEHPLLQSPGMFVINDGEFEKHDALNIRRFGENTKSMDAAKIGKFGLGLKLEMRNH